MPNIYINDIGMNDDLQDVIRKANDNFKRITSSVMKINKGGIRRESELTDSKIDELGTDLRSEIASEIEQMNLLIDQKIEDLDNKIEVLDNLLDQFEESVKVNIAKRVANFYKIEMGVESVSHQDLIDLNTNKTTVLVTIPQYESGHPRISIMVDSTDDVLHTVEFFGTNVENESANGVFAVEIWTKDGSNFQHSIDVHWIAIYPSRDYLDK